MANIWQQRAINKAVMTDTCHLCKENKVLKDAVDYSIANQFMWSCDQLIDLRPWKKEETKYIVSKKKTYEAAKDYKNQNVTVLNFANNHSIGGAPFFSNAQEESLCRTSTLYPCLKAMKKEFYDRHTTQYDNKMINYMGNADMIYTPDVIVMKTQDSAPELLPENEWYRVNVITSAAPELQGRFELPKDYEEIIRERLYRILLLAKTHNTDVLILGAYGCGAFHNPPEIISRVFMELLPDFCFKTVEFAVYCRDDSTNYDVFKEAVEGWYCDRDR